MNIIRRNSYLFTNKQICSRFSIKHLCTLHPNGFVRTGNSPHWTFPKTHPYFTNLLKQEYLLIQYCVVQDIQGTASKKKKYSTHAFEVDFPLRGSHNNSCVMPRECNAKNPARALSLWRITIDVDSVKVQWPHTVIIWCAREAHGYLIKSGRKFKMLCTAFGHQKGLF